MNNYSLFVRQIYILASWDRIQAQISVFPTLEKRKIPPKTPFWRRSPLSGMRSNRGSDAAALKSRSNSAAECLPRQPQVGKQSQRALTNTFAGCKAARKQPMTFFRSQRRTFAKIHRNRQATKPESPQIRKERKIWRERPQSTKFRCKIYKYSAELSDSSANDPLLFSRKLKRRSANLPRSRYFYRENPLISP